MNGTLFDNIYFEIDSKITVHVFHSRKTDITEFGNIIDARQTLLSTSFTISGVFVSRITFSILGITFAGTLFLIILILSKCLVVNLISQEYFYIYLIYN